MHFKTPKTPKTVVLSLILLGIVSSASATTHTFTKDLYYGMPSGDSEVKLLQLFLRDQNLYTGPVTGNFLSLTFAGVKAFQAKELISPVSGYFGILSRTRANDIIATTGTPSGVTLKGGKNIQASTSVKETDLTALQARVNTLSLQVLFLQGLMKKQKTTIATTTTQKATTTISSVPTGMLWGAYHGSGDADLAYFENLVGRAVNIRSVFYAFSDDFPLYYKTSFGAKGKILLVFWEPTTDYDNINSGSQDAKIKKFAEDAKVYGYPVILAPFHEMNGNWEVWSGMGGNNTPAKFITAWKKIHDVFVTAGATNVKFALAFNSTSVPDVVGNQFSDYYPGDAYVDYIGVDGFNFGNPWQSFQSIFEKPITKLVSYNKPIYIFSMASVPGTEKAAWITDALAVQIKKYPIAGWVWFNQNGADGNWLVNSDSASLTAFQAVLP